MGFLNYKERIEDGDTVIIYLDVLSLYALRVTPGEVFQTKYGALKHDTLIGHRYGTAVDCSKGWAYVLFPTPELWTLTLSHRTQILYMADISLTTFMLDLKPGKVVCECGTGSGSMSHALARAVAPGGVLHTCDYHEERTAQACEEFSSHGLSSVVFSSKRDVCVEGFPVTPSSADAIFLDVPKPWEAIEGAATALCKDGRLCSFSPCIEQVQRTTSTLLTSGFGEVTTYECLMRPFEVKKPKGRADSPAICLPALKGPGHTGYLTFASKTDSRVNNEEVSKTDVHLNEDQDV